MSEEDSEFDLTMAKEGESHGEHDFIAPDIWYSYLNKDPTSIIEEIIYREEISDVQALLDHLLKKKFYKKDTPIEVIFQGRKLPLDSQLQDLKTTKAHPIKIVYKYIKYGDHLISQSFFNQRSIEFQTTILVRSRFESSLLEIIDPNFTITDAASEAVRNTYLFAKDSEYAVHSITMQFLIASLKKPDPSRILSRKKITIQSDKHEAIPDHTLYNPENDKILLICEDKKVDMDQAVLQNFDQLRSFSFTEQGENCRYVYGLATNLTAWRFCCYIPYSDNENVTANNFIVSKEIPTHFDDEDLPSRDFIQRIARIIRGFLTKDVDAIVSAKLKPP